MKTTRTIQVPHNDNILNVDFEFELLLQNNGIGYYEYRGSPGYDYGRDYYEVDGLSWDKNMYTSEQNMAISNFTTSPEFEKIEEEVCEQALKVEF